MDPSTRRQWEVLNEHILWWLPLVVIVLAAVLIFPIYARHRERSREAACLANLRALYAATQQYAREHDGRLPTGRDWPAQIGPYLRDPGALHCPSDDVDSPVSYGMNPMLWGAKLDASRDPSVLYWDGHDTELIPRHNGGANYLFADGHAMWMANPPQGTGI